MKPDLIWLRFEKKIIVRNLFYACNIFEKVIFAQYKLL